MCIRDRVYTMHILSTVWGTKKVVGTVTGDLSNAWKCRRPKIYEENIKIVDWKHVI